VICNGSGCHLHGSEDLLEEITKLLGIGDGETTRDGLFSLEIQSCIGACGQSPVLSVNGNYYAGLTITALRELINQFQADGSR
jgi:NADH-quinone oxidoreductase subunit E